MPAYVLLRTCLDAACYRADAVRVLNPGPLDDVLVFLPPTRKNNRYGVKEYR